MKTIPVANLDADAIGERIIYAEQPDEYDTCTLVTVEQSAWSGSTWEVRAQTYRRMYRHPDAPFVWDSDFAVTVTKPERPAYGESYATIPGVMRVGLDATALAVAARALAVAANLCGALDNGFSAEAWAQAMYDIAEHEQEDDLASAEADSRDPSLPCTYRYIESAHAEREWQERNA